MARRHGPPEECPAGRHTPQGSAATTTRRNRPFPRRTCGETKPTGWPVPPTGHKSSAGPRKPPPFFPRSLVPDAQTIGAAIVVTASPVRQEGWKNLNLLARSGKKVWRRLKAPQKNADYPGGMSSPDLQWTTERAHDTATRQEGAERSARLLIVRLP